MKLVTCDRCGKVDRGREQWMHLSFYGQEDDIDLCADCLDAFKKWVNR